MSEAVGMRIRPEEAQRELARRELARRRLIPFTEYVSQWYRAYRHHRLIAEYLELVETYIRTEGRTGIGRLLLEFPPRMGKSELTSRHFPAWFLGRNPDAQVILASYGADLAVGHSKAVRTIVDGDRFRAVFGDLATVDSPVELSTDSRGAEEWQLAAPHRGIFRATGVGGAITGKGANLLIIDDPFKNREEAESENHRDRVWDWWTSSAYSRLEKGSAVVGMFTRWHGDDWAGRLLREMASGNPKVDQYVVVCAPAIWEEPEYDGDWEEFYLSQLREGIYEQREDPLGRKPGEALWPEKYNEDDYERIKASSGTYDWEALYQQRPFRRGGNYFKREWFVVVDDPPSPDKVIRRIRAYDKAGSKKGLGDYMVGTLLSMTESGRVYVEHVVREKGTPSQREETILKTALADRSRTGPETVVWHQQDPGTSGLESAQNTNKRLSKKGFEAHYLPVTGDKEVRAGPWATALESGYVYLVRGGWNTEYIDEHAAFPKGRYDDQVDASSWGYLRLVDAGPVIIAGA